MGYFMVFAKKVAFWKRGPEFEKNIWYSNNIWYLSNSNQIQIWFLGFFEYQIKFKYDFEEKFTSLTQSFWAEFEKTRKIKCRSMSMSIFFFKINVDQCRCRFFFSKCRLMSIFFKFQKKCRKNVDFFQTSNKMSKISMLVSF